jgi:hypothetical protein
MTSVTNTSNIPTSLPFSTGLQDDMICYVSQFLNTNDRAGMSITNVSTNTLLGDMNTAIEKRKTIEKDAIETLLKSNIDAFLVDGGFSPTRVFRFDMLTAYLNQFGIYDDSIIDENGLFKNDPIYISDNFDLLKPAITLTPEKAFDVGMKMITQYETEDDGVFRQKFTVAMKMISQYEIKSEDDGVFKLTDSKGFHVAFVTENSPKSVYGFNGDPNVLILGPNVTRILEHEYWNKDYLKTVIMTDSVTSIGHAAFANCYNLMTVRMSSSIESIGISAFQGCENLVSIKIPELVTKIESNTFSGCRKLISITIPNSVTTIETQAFTGCRGLIDIDIPESVTTIGSHIFEYCWSLETIRLPSSIRCIKLSMFINCKRLRTVSIPSSVTVIYGYAFYGCVSLESITCYDSDEKGVCAYVPKSVTWVGSTSFSSCPLESEVKKSGVSY